MALRLVAAWVLLRSAVPPLAPMLRWSAASRLTAPYWTRRLGASSSSSTNRSRRWCCNWSRPTARSTPLGTFRARRPVRDGRASGRDSTTAATSLSWRVVSEDGHPIGGSVVFSIGTAGGAAPDIPYDADGRSGRGDRYRPDDHLCRPLLGVGGLFFAAFVAAPPTAAIRAMVVALAVTPIALLLVGRPPGPRRAGPAPGRIVRPEPWRDWIRERAMATAAIIAVFAALAALVGLGARRPIHQALSLLSLVALGVAFASTGHAGAAPPQWLTRPAVFIHTVAVAVWVGHCCRSDCFSSAATNRALGGADALLGGDSLCGRPAGACRHRPRGRPDRHPRGGVDDRLRAGASWRSVSCS